MAYDAECSVEGCAKLAACRGLCPMHYQRQRRRGDVGTARPERVGHGGAVCAVAGCGQPRRKREWCATHYSQWRRLGEVRPLKKWNPRVPCIVCGEPSGVERRFCTAACRALWTSHGGQVPTSVPCAVCGHDIDLTVKSKRGYRKHANTRVCRRCRLDVRKHGMSAAQLADRDGTACGICGLVVDMTLRAPDPRRASVDHILPRALGGSNDPENLQLAHLRCNSGKRDRVAA